MKHLFTLLCLFSVIAITNVAYSFDEASKTEADYLLSIDTGEYPVVVFEACGSASQVNDNVGNFPLLFISFHNRLALESVYNEYETCSDRPLQEANTYG